jgi:hypothetical protein
VNLDEFFEMEEEAKQQFDRQDTFGEEMRECWMWAFNKGVHYGTTQAALGALAVDKELARKYFEQEIAPGMPGLGNLPESERLHLKATYVHDVLTHPTMLEKLRQWGKTH